MAGWGKALMVQAKENQNVEIVLSEAEQLREQRDRFLAFAFAASDLLLEVGDDSLIRYAVGATNQLLGGSPQEVVGQGWLDLFVEEDRPLLVSKIGNLAASSKAARFSSPLSLRCAVARAALAWGILATVMVQ